MQPALPDGCYGTITSVSACNKRGKHSDGQFVSWEEQLSAKCIESLIARQERRAKILTHIERYRYPRLTIQERHAIRVIAESHTNIKGEAEKSLTMYRALDEAFVKGAYEPLSQSAALEPPPFTA